MFVEAIPKELSFGRCGQRPRFGSPLKRGLGGCYAQHNQAQLGTNCRACLIPTVWCIMEAYSWNFTPGSPGPVGEHKEE
ncbi:hypothetical protein H7U05_24445 [Priestia megaterium]|uniref:hypothetical protein n=1 Tax=Priestia megaterium TaxID=1404 RepID=UPI001C8D264D|nr:hypothetical protein [Priestia megaterium]MBY0200402.1 hypothetical protein [Priestia megaterium]